MMSTSLEKILRIEQELKQNKKQQEMRTLKKIIGKSNNLKSVNLSSVKTSEYRAFKGSKNKKNKKASFVKH